MPQIRLYNTLTRKKQALKPINDKQIKLYTCGQTVYYYTHIGNLRTYFFEDVLRKTLEYVGYTVKHVMNITDVGHLTSDQDEGEDKLEKGAKREGKTVWEIAEHYTQDFLENLDAMKIKRADIVCKATEHIPEMIALIQRLEKKGFTYATPTGIYFDVTRFKNYGILTGQKLHEKKKGVRGEVVVDSTKKHPADFRLWQLSQPNHAMQWDSPWGRGYPGWHIECSAMAMKYLGEELDIHCGGMDHIPVHHTNEIAQSEGATGKRFSKLWLHGAFMLIEGERMGKSKNNFYRLTDLQVKGYSPLDYRMALLQAHYRSQYNFTWKGLEDAKSTRQRLNVLIQRLKEQTGKENPAIPGLIQKTRSTINKHLANDLNTPYALSELIAFTRKTNTYIEKGKIGRENAENILSFLHKLDRVFGVMDFESKTFKIPKEVSELVQKREQSRRDKKWAEADALRKQIHEKGWGVQDTPLGPKVKPAKEQSSSF
ncbi:MAG: cysteine--tRNA ligase [Candidatus Diapherotrites archaeon]|nr:cysteine--tRNA ligase [Candidatus Diapherotrites archaeon]